MRKIRYDKNGEIILDSVDGRIRSMALGIEQIDTRDKLKNKFHYLKFKIYILNL